MHKVLLTRGAENAYLAIRRGDRRSYERIREALHDLARDPRQGKPLKAELSGRWSSRVGSYRIIYEIENLRLIVLVIDIGHRREIYR